MEPVTYRAILIGNSFFPEDPHNLVELEGPRKDPGLIHNALCDPYVGLFSPINATLVQERPRSKICRDLAGFFTQARRDDILLVYYSGHGVLDDRNRLFLCSSDTQTDRELLEATAVSAEWVNSLIDDSAARTCIVLLDCCHAGAFFKGGDLSSSFRGLGRYAVMSCRTGDLVRDATPNGTSYFTQYFCESLHSVPDLDGDGFVGLSEVFWNTHRRLVDEQKQHPKIGWSGEEDVKLARRGSAPPGPPRDPITRPVRRVAPAPPVNEGPLPSPAISAAATQQSTSAPSNPRYTGSPPHEGRTSTSRSSLRKPIVLVAILVALAIVGSAIAIVGFRHRPKVWTGDPFAAGPIDHRHWDVSRDDGVSVAQDSGLIILLASNPTAQVKGGSVTTRCLFHSDYDVEVSYRIIDWPPGSLARLGILGGQVSPQRINQGPGVDYYQMNINNPLPGQGDSPAHSLLNAFSTHDTEGQLRLTRVGATYTGYARSQPELGWTNLGSATKASIVPTPITLSSWGNMTGAVRIAAFSHFQILGGSCKST